MGNLDYDPIYKILCICLMFLVPLAPAFLLYIIAPDERFKANGIFAGFKINATGSTALYIVLFAALYPKINDVTNTIGTVRQLRSKIDTLESNAPWKIQYNLTLMSDRTHKISDIDYQNIINTDSISCFPRPVNFNSNTKQLSFYVDHDIIKNPNDTLTGTIRLKNGFGTASFAAVVKQKDYQARTITIASIYYKQSSSGYNVAQNNVLDAGDALSSFPTVHNAPK